MTCAFLAAGSADAAESIGSAARLEDEAAAGAELINELKRGTERGEWEVRWSGGDPSFGTVRRATALCHTRGSTSTAETGQQWPLGACSTVRGV